MSDLWSTWGAGPAKGLTLEAGCFTIWSVSRRRKFVVWRKRRPGLGLSGAVTGSITFQWNKNFSLWHLPATRLRKTLLESRSPALVWDQLNSEGQMHLLEPHLQAQLNSNSWTMLGLGQEAALVGQLAQAAWTVPTWCLSPITGGLPSLSPGHFFSLAIPTAHSRPGTGRAPYLIFPLTHTCSQPRVPLKSPTHLCAAPSW